MYECVKKVNLRLPTIQISEKEMLDGKGDSIMLSVGSLILTESERIWRCWGKPNGMGKGNSNESPRGLVDLEGPRIPKR